MCTLVCDEDLFALPLGWAALRPALRVRLTPLSTLFCLPYRTFPDWITTQFVDQCIHYTYSITLIST